MNFKVYRSVFKQAFFMIFLMSLVACIKQEVPRQEVLNIPLIKVLLATTPQIDTLTFSGVFFMETEEARYEFGNANNRVFVEPIPDGFKIFNENRLFLFRPSDSAVFVPEKPESEFVLDNKQYRGSCIIQKRDSLKLNFINETDLESYLKGVVPAEIFTNDDSFLEAIKAQAICARTYALRKMQNSKSNLRFPYF